MNKYENISISTSLNEAINESYTIKEDFIKPTYKVGDTVFKGDATGYQGHLLVKGDITNLPKELYKYIRYVYFKEEPDIYIIEFKLPDDYDLFESDYKRFKDIIKPILSDNGLIMIE